MNQATAATTAPVARTPPRTAIANVMLAVLRDGRVGEWDLSSRVLRQAIAVLAMSFAESTVAAAAATVPTTRMTQREIFYRRKRHGDATDRAKHVRADADEDASFADEREVARAVEAALRLTGAATRSELGIRAAPKGLIRGPVEWRPAASQTWHTAWPTASVPAEHERASYRVVPAAATLDVARPRFILVVEKFTVFHRIVESSSFVTRFPCVVVTGRGFPDEATKTTVRDLSAQLGLDVVVLCDLNPHGLALMETYASTCMSTTRFHLAGLLVRDVFGPGLNLGIDVGGPGGLVPFTAADDAALASLLAKLADNESSFARVVRSELAELQSRRVKLDLDALHSCSPSFLADVWLPHAVARCFSTAVPAPPL